LATVETRPLPFSIWYKVLLSIPARSLTYMVVSFLRFLASLISSPTCFSTFWCFGNKKY